VREKRERAMERPTRSITPEKRVLNWIIITKQLLFTKREESERKREKEREKGRKKERKIKKRERERERERER
jgi:hypothetical protein